MFSHPEKGLEPKRAAHIGSFPNVSPEKEDNEGDREKRG